MPERRTNRLHLSVPHIGANELSYVQDAFSSNWLSTVGPNLNELEARFEELVGRPAVALGCGTAGIHLGFKLLGVGAGDEVVTPTLTFAAGCNPILYEKAVPVFLDSERQSWNLDPNRLAEFLARRAAANRLPKAVSVVHLFGQSADLDPILETCKRYDIPLLEDAAESLGARYKGRHPGTFGHVGVFSFNGNKIITGTSGGMLVSPRTEWVEKARFWSTQARDADPGGVRNYVHSELGYNYRLSNVLAGIVRGQLEVLELRVQQRRAVFERYRQAFVDLPGIEPQPEADFGEAKSEVRSQELEEGSWKSEVGRQRAEGRSQKAEAEARCQKLEDRSQNSEVGNRQSLHTRWLSCFLIDEARFGMSAADLIRYLDAANVEARPVWKPMHTQPLYRRCECIGGEVAEDLNRRGICLPSSSCLTEEEQQFVVERVREAHGQAMAGQRGRVSFSAPLSTAAEGKR